jgi:hypothetical protein
MTLTGLTPDEGQYPYNTENVAASKSPAVSAETGLTPKRTILHKV